MRSFRTRRAPTDSLLGGAHSASVLHVAASHIYLVCIGTVLDLSSYTFFKIIFPFPGGGYPGPFISLLLFPAAAALLTRGRRRVLRGRAGALNRSPRRDLPLCRCGASLLSWGGRGGPLRVRKHERPLHGLRVVRLSEVPHRVLQVGPVAVLGFLVGVETLLVLTTVPLRLFLGLCPGSVDPRNPSPVHRIMRELRRHSLFLFFFPPDVSEISSAPFLLFLKFFGPTSSCFATFSHRVTPLRGSPGRRGSHPLFRPIPPHCRRGRRPDPSPPRDLPC